MGIDALIRRDRIVTAAGLLIVTALAWLYLLREPLMASAMRAGHVQHEVALKGSGSTQMDAPLHAPSGGADAATEVDLPD